MKHQQLDRVQKMQTIVNFESLIRNLAHTQLGAAEQFMEKGISREKVNDNLELMNELVELKNIDYQSAINSNGFWMMLSGGAVLCGLTYMICGLSVPGVGKSAVIGGGSAFGGGVLCLVTSLLNCVRLVKNAKALYKDLGDSVEELLNAIYGEQGYSFSRNEEVGSLNVQYNGDSVGVMRY